MDNVSDSISYLKIKLWLVFKCFVRLVPVDFPYDKMSPVFSENDSLIHLCAPYKINVLFLNFSFNLKY